MGPADPEVYTSTGRVRGSAENGVAVFRGIPFAQPPLGALRFQAPRPPRPWDGVRDATRFGPPAPQAPFPGSPPAPPAAGGTGEWLTVNVWTPAPHAAALPVLVWVHGGAYLFGSAAEPGYDGSAFAAGGAVFVSCNYRLGVEGFAQIPGAPANRGLLDLVAALRWVQENIARFGGDPANVTVFGESAGAGVISALLAMDDAAGLFRRAIAQSVPGTVFTPALAADVTRAVAEAAGVPATREALSQTEPMRLAAASMSVTGRMRQFPRWGAVRLTDTPFSPVVDGEVLPRAPWRALMSGAAREVELLTGHNRDEYRLFIAMSGRLGRITDEDAATVLESFAPAPDGPAGYRKAYPEADAGRLFEVVFSDWLFRMPTLHLAQAHAASGGRTFLYELRAEAPAAPETFGACHALDVPLVFGPAGQGIGATLAGERPPAEFRALGDLMRSEWLRFAACGDPGWPGYGTERRTTRVYDLRPGVGPYPEETSMRLWERHQFDALDLSG
ncbi:MAG TPA: carboxylesterase family protein [Trebonia sp.]|nr:carboxylesterase family protein [Trebonia sp.]